MWAPHAPRGFSWTRTQSVWVAAFVVAMSFVPARCTREVPPRDASADPRPPGTWLLYEDGLEVNAAAAEDFELLPGVGPTLARRLVAARREAGGFCRVEEVAAAARLGEARWKAIAPRLSVRPAPRCSSSSRG